MEQENIIDTLEIYEGEACLLLNQVMKGKNKRKKNKNQLPVL